MAPGNLCWSPGSFSGPWVALVALWGSLLAPGEIWWPLGRFGGPQGAFLYPKAFQPVRHIFFSFFCPKDSVCPQSGRLAPSRGSLGTCASHVPVLVPVPVPVLSLGAGSPPVRSRTGETPHPEQSPHAPVPTAAGAAPGRLGGPPNICHWEGEPSPDATVDVIPAIQAVAMVTEPPPSRAPGSRASPGGDGVQAGGEVQGFVGCRHRHGDGPHQERAGWG